MSQDLILEKADGYGILTLNRPDKLNAITVGMLYEGFEEIFEKVRKNEDIRALIVTGSGRAFCSGFDVTAFETLENPSTKWEQFEVYGDFALRVRNLHKPIIAAINGVAVGAGLSLALLCDIRIASDSAKFSCAWVKRGLIPDMGASYFLPRIVGFPKSLQLMLTGEVIDAKEAEKIGLVNKVVAADSLMEVAKDMASILAKGPSLALGLIKQTAYSGLVNDLEQQLFFETAVQKKLLQTFDCKEAAKAFTENREPRFRGS